ncbi:MAG: undecaprenyl-phosphate glucose phosphotransferase [Polyangia bacterium]
MPFPAEAHDHATFVNPASSSSSTTWDDLAAPHYTGARTMSISIAFPRDSLGPFQRIVDLLLILLAHSLAIIVAAPTSTAQADLQSLFALLTFTAVTAVFPVYRPRGKESLIAELGPLLLSWVVTALALDGLLWAYGAAALPSYAWALSAALLLSAWRVVDGPLVRALRTRGQGWTPRSSIAVLGATASAYHLCQEFARRPWLRRSVLGIYDDRAIPRHHRLWPGVAYLGTSRELLVACAQGKVDTLFIALPLAAAERIRTLRRELLMTKVAVFLIADPIPHYASLASRWTTIGGSALVSVHDTPMRGAYALAKRLEDVLGGLVAVALLALPMLVIATMVKLTSQGPILFRQRRYGLNGREIRVLKFRTMSVCEDGNTVTQAQRGDTRVTRVGRFLRRTSLDELPQFVQVLAGNMSIVGPRPHAVAHNEHYRLLIPRYMLRHKVKPGITGWAQVNGWRGETPTVGLMQKRVEHDLEYIDNWSLLLDVKIVLLTVFGRASRRNAF